MHLGREPPKPESIFFLSSRSANQSSRALRGLGTTKGFHGISSDLGLRDLFSESNVPSGMMGLEASSCCQKIPAWSPTLKP